MISKKSFKSNHWDSIILDRSGALVEEGAREVNNIRVSAIISIIFFINQFNKTINEMTVDGLTPWVLPKAQKSGNKNYVITGSSRIFQVDLASLSPGHKLAKLVTP